MFTVIEKMMVGATMCDCVGRFGDVARPWLMRTVARRRVIGELATPHVLPPYMISPRLYCGRLASQQQSGAVASVLGS